MTAPPVRPRPLRLTVDQFDGLAAGYGDPGAIAVLNAGQLSRRRLLIRAVADQPPARGMRDPALRLLAAAQRRAPGAVATVVGHPYVAAWARRCLRLLDGATPDAPDPPELGHLAGIAAAAATRAGLRFAITVPARHGAVGLPTLGTAHGLGAGPVLVHATGDALVFTGPAARVRVPAPLGAERPGWAPRREVALDGFTLAIEDADFYRDCYSWRPRPRLSDEEVRRVSDLLVAAWRLIVTEHPAHAAAMRLALRSVVPVDPPPEGGAVSAASRLAYGSVAASIPPDPAALALLLIHEFQHMKLNGLLDLVPLHGDDGAPLHFAPWRRDPRSVGALLHGTYAHLGVADFWRRQRHRATGRHRRRAEFEFAYWLAQSTRAARTLVDCDDLTDHGRHFVRNMRETLRRWTAEPVDATVRHGAPELIAAAAVRWRLENLRPTEAELDRLHAAWRGGGEPPLPATAPPVAGPTTAGPAVVAGLPALIRRRLVDPDGGRPDAEADPAHGAYLAGDFAKAADGYAERVAREPADDDAWVGLALAMTAAGHPAAPALTRMPETVRALYVRMRPRGPAEPAAWLARGLTAEP